MSEKKQITISSVLSLLDDGKGRKEIGEHFELSAVDLKKLFQHPKLKNKKPRKPTSFELIDDTEDKVVTETVQETGEALPSAEVAETQEPSQGLEEYVADSLPAPTTQTL